MNQNYNTSALSTLVDRATWKAELRKEGSLWVK